MKEKETMPFGFLTMKEQKAVFMALCRKIKVEYDSLMFQCFSRFCYELQAEVEGNALTNKDLEWGVLLSIRDWDREKKEME